MIKRYLGIEQVAVWLRRLKTFAYDTRISITLLIILTICNISIYISFHDSIGYNDRYMYMKKDSNTTMDMVYSMNDTIHTIYNNTQLVSSISDMIIIVDTYDNVYDDSVCSGYAYITCESSYVSYINQYTPFIRSYTSHSSIQSHKILIHTNDIQYDTIDALVNRNILSYYMHAGLVCMYTVYRYPIYDDGAYIVYMQYYHIGYNNDIIYYTYDSIYVRTNNTTIVDIISSILLSIYILSYVCKYLIKLNFHFDNDFLRYGTIHIVNSIYMLIILIMKIYRYNRGMSYSNVSSMIHIYNMYRCSIYMQCMITGIEYIKMVVYLRRYKYTVRLSYNIVYRSMYTLYKILLFIYIIIIVKDVSILLYDHMIHIHTYLDILIYHPFIYVYESDVYSNLIYIFMMIFDHISHIIIVCILYTCVYNAHHIEYDVKDKIVTDIIDSISSISTKHQKFMIELSSYIDSISKKKVRLHSYYRKGQT